MTDERDHKEDSDYTDSEPDEFEDMDEADKKELDEGVVKEAKAWSKQLKELREVVRDKCKEHRTKTEEELWHRSEMKAVRRALTKAIWIVHQYKVRTRNSLELCEQVAKDTAEREEKRAKKAKLSK